MIQRGIDTIQSSKMCAFERGQAVIRIYREQVEDELWKSYLCPMSLDRSQHPSLRRARKPSSHVRCYHPANIIQLRERRHISNDSTTVDPLLCDVYKKNILSIHIHMYVHVLLLPTMYYSMWIMRMLKFNY
jgi:hypothetical protein